MPPRRKMLAGGLLVVLTFWAVDTFIVRARPQQARAVSTGGSRTERAPSSADVGALLAALAEDPASRPALDVRQARRDLFTPTQTMLARLPRSQSHGSAAGGGQAEAAPPFEQRHTLQGVVLGPVPLALVDGVLLSPGAQVDGDYELETIARDHVVFRTAGGDRVRLHVTGTDQE